MKAGEELEWLKEVSSVPLQQAVRHQQAAFSAFFDGRARYPRYKSRTGGQSAEYTRSGFRSRDGRALVVIDRWYPQLEDLLRVRAPARRTVPVDAALGVPVVRHPA